MSFNKKIDDFMESRADFLTKKHTHRESYGHSIVNLTILMARHLDKCSASFENKILLLLKIPEIEAEAKDLHESFVMNEIFFKKYRDLDDLYKSKIIELQSRRKHENGIL